MGRAPQEVERKGGARGGRLCVTVQNGHGVQSDGTRPSAATLHSCCTSPPSNGPQQALLPPPTSGATATFPSTYLSVILICFLPATGDRILYLWTMACRALAVPLALAGVHLLLLAPSSDCASLGQRTASMVSSSTSLANVSAASPAVVVAAPVTPDERAPDVASSRLISVFQAGPTPTPYRRHANPHSVSTPPTGGFWLRAPSPTSIIEQVVWDPRTGATMWAKADVTAATLFTGTETNTATKRWRKWNGYPGDHAGHIIAQSPGGPGHLLYGIFSQNSGTNSGRWSTWKGDVADAVTMRLPSWRSWSMSSSSQLGTSPGVRGRRWWQALSASPKPPMQCKYVRRKWTVRQARNSVGGRKGEAGTGSIGAPKVAAITEQTEAYSG